MTDRRDAECLANMERRAPGSSGYGEEMDTSASLLLECRVEWLEASLGEARAEADRAREALAFATAREAEQARRLGEVQEALAEANAEILSLWRRIDRAENLRGEQPLSSQRSGLAPDRDELFELRQEVSMGKERSQAKDRYIENLRRRLDEMSASRERLFDKVASWQRLVREDGPEAADLAEFIAELRAEILSLEGERARSEEREQALRDSLAVLQSDQATSTPKGQLQDSSLLEDDFGPGTEPRGLTDWDEAKDDASSKDRVSNRNEIDVNRGHGPRKSSSVGLELISCHEPFSTRSSRGSTMNPSHSRSALVEALADEVVQGHSSVRLRAARRLLSLEGQGAAGALAAGLASAESVYLKASLLVLLGRTGDYRAIGAVRPWLKAKEAVVRSAAYEAAARLLEGNEEELAAYLRAGLSDPDPVVRRRSILAVATAKSISSRPLLDPLKSDPDTQVRRLVHKVLSTLPLPEKEEGEDVVLALTIASTRASSML